MITLIFAALIAPAVPTASAAQPAKCVPQGPQLAEADRRAVPKKLGELPPAHQYLTVYRAIDNCPAPVIVRYGLGRQQR